MKFAKLRERTLAQMAASIVGRLTASFLIRVRQAFVVFLAM